MVIMTHGPDETFRLGRLLAGKLRGGEVIALCGDLGSGKTIFTQGLAAGLGVKGSVRSPSFTIMNVHVGRLRLGHVDFYRLGGVAELVELGLEEFCQPDTVLVVEWAEKFIRRLPGHPLLIRIEWQGEGKRKLEFGEEFAADYLAGVFDRQAGAGLVGRRRAAGRR